MYMETCSLHLVGLSEVTSGQRLQMVPYTIVYLSTLAAPVVTVSTALKWYLVSQTLNC